MQQVAKGGMTQKQMQDAQATIAAISAQIELRKQAAEALKESMNDIVKWPIRKHACFSNRKTAQMSFRQDSKKR